MNAADAFARALDRASHKTSVDESALAYVAHGIPVFPCATNEKHPAVAEGFRAASADPALVRSWWTAMPTANIGIPTGTVSGFVVVDVDVHGPVNGYDALAHAQARGLVDGWVAAVRSPSNGLHLYFPAAGGSEQRSWQCARAGIDFRGDGGYIIVPPSSRIIEGRARRYEVLQFAGESTQAFDAGQLRDFLDPPRGPRWAPDGQSAMRAGDVHRLAEWVARRQEGERNHGVFWAACKMAEKNVPPVEALDALTTAGVQTGLSEREVTATVRSAYRTVQGAPVRSLSHTASTTPHKPPRVTDSRELA